jgi:hypothetical protein
MGFKELWRRGKSASLQNVPAKKIKFENSYQ